MAYKIAILFLLLLMAASPCFGQLSIGPGCLWSERVDKELLGVTYVHRVGKWSPNVIASWSDPLDWSPNLVRLKLDRPVYRHDHGAVLLGAGVDWIKIRGEYDAGAAITLTHVLRVKSRGRWVVAGVWRPEQPTWAIITRFNVVVWRGHVR